MPKRLSTIRLLLGVALACASFLHAEETYYYRAGDQPSSEPTKSHGAMRSSATPGELRAAPAKNVGSWQFNGRNTIVFGAPSRAAGFDVNFTWEGFFLSPSTNQVLAETGIADRLVTQFAFDKGNWTRLAIGLTADKQGKPRLSVELEGFDGRTFGQGRVVVAPDRWHHFALVHRGTAAAARIQWYLDYELSGEILLGGQANQNTLRPPGKAPFAIGARLLTGGSVNRGFKGWIDEVRLTPQPLDVKQFLRTKENRTKTPAVTAVVSTDSFWHQRHAWAAKETKTWAKPRKLATAIDAHFPKATRRSTIDDLAFLRRLSLAVQGRIPTLGEIRHFENDKHPDRRGRAIDRFLASPDWAHAWVGYWQDVLAENPSVVFPTLNNSGPFRQWIFESFRDNRPFDQFVTELMMMETAPGQSPDASPAGFALATRNDAPLVMRTHVVMKAFAGVDLKCARCHDSPVDDATQSELFALAAYLNEQPLQVPATSLAAIKKSGGLITSTLEPGQKVAPSATKRLFADATRMADLMPINKYRPRAQFAALVTSPRNSRFSDVVVNRVWKRLFGRGLFEPVDRWQSPVSPRDEILLRTLSADFVRSGYDMKHLTSRILRSEIWQARRDSQRRVSAEQLVDSLFTAVDKDFEAETLGVHATDPGAAQLPRPRRAWQYSALPNERDRPALAMPVSQTIVDVMTTFGWSGSRQQPRSQRENDASALQALIMSNGLLSQRIVRLSDRSTITNWYLERISLGELVDRLYLCFLSRRPDAQERQQFTEYLSPTFANRRTGKPARPWKPLSTFQPDWRKHLQPEQTQLLLQAQRIVAVGELPTERLTPAFRECLEDVVWALINSPEFVVVP